MKITDPDIIKSGEKDLIDAIKEDLDLDAVKDVIKKRMGAASLSATGGEIIVHNNEIAFRIDINLNLSGSLMFDRQGNYIPGEGEPILPEEAPSGFDEEDTDLVDIPGEIQSAAPDAEDDTADENAVSDESFDEDELNINLPDYSLDDADEEDEDLIEDDEIKSGGEDDLAQLEKELGLEDDLEDMDVLDDGSIHTADPSPAEEDDGLGSPVDSANDSLDDDDISDILKESQEFWEQKKDQ